MNLQCLKIGLVWYSDTQYMSGFQLFGFLVSGCFIPDFGQKILCQAIIVTGCVMQYFVSEI